MSRRASILRLCALAAFLIAVTVAGLLIPLPSVTALRSSVGSAGPLGAVLFVIGYALLTLTPAPKSVLSIVAGIVGGFAAGVLAVYLGALLGAAAAFLIGRRLGRRAVERLTGTRMETLDHALATRGFLAILTLRLIPVVPFTAINYGAGLTGVRRRDYALGTAIGIIPGDLAYVAVGAYGVRLGWEFWAALVGLAALTAAGSLLGLRMRRRAARDQGDLEASEAPDV